MMSEGRTVLCPVCGYSNSPQGECRICGQLLALDANDRHDVQFVGADDGHHSWQSPPTSVHERYRCKNYGYACAGCVHEPSSDLFCFEGRIDIRRRRSVSSDGTVLYTYNDWIEKG